MNGVVVFIYWVFLHAEYMKMPHIAANPFRQGLAVANHTLPAIASFTNYMMTKGIEMVPWNGLYYGPMVIIPYCFVNWLGTLANQGPIYWFLDWNKPLGYVVPILMFVLSSSIHNGFAYLMLLYRPVKRLDPSYKQS